MTVWSAPDELGLAEPAFRRFAEPAGSLVTVHAGAAARQPRCRARQNPGPRR